MRCSRPRKPDGSVSSRPSIQPATSPWSWLPAISTSSPSGPSAAPRSANTGAASSAMSRLGAVAQLDAVAEDHEPVDAARPPRAAARAARAAAAGRCAVPEPMCRSETTSVRTRGHPRVPRPMAAAGRHPGRRLLARARGPVRDDAARATSAPTSSRSSARTAATTRAPGARRGAARTAPTTSRSTATSARSRSTSPTRATASWRARLGERADVLVESFRPGLMAELGPRRRHAARAQPGPGLLLGDRVRHRRGGPRAARLRLPAAGDGRADARHRRAGRAAAEGRRRGRRPDRAGCSPPTASRPRCSSARAPAAGATSRSR